MIDFNKQENKKYATHGIYKTWIFVVSIIYVTCRDHLLTLYLDDGTTLFDDCPLHTLETELADCGFFRINHNTLVNLRYVTQDYYKNGQKYIRLAQKVLKVARRRVKNWNNLEK
jgi:DNA-binding LytR/AlgR family response regulator